MNQNRTICKALIPANGVHITETQYPKGFHAARYDARGFVADSRGRWFPTFEAANKHADMLEVA